MLADALKTMDGQRIGSMPIVDGGERPLGIFTTQDVIGRVVLAQLPLTVPIRDVMSAPAVTLSNDATAGDAALVMARRGLRHVVVQDGDGKVAGLSCPSATLQPAAASVRGLASPSTGRDIPTLVQCAADIRALSHALVAQAWRQNKLTRMVSSLKDQLTAGILAGHGAAFRSVTVTLCWLGMGSEGRSEQTIATDQDNGLIFVSHDEAVAPGETRERLLPFAREVNEALARCGFPLCKGGVMAMNPRWCASLDEWKASFESWIDRGDPVSLLTACVFFDFRPLWGEPQLAEALRADIAQRAQANPRFLKQMSDNALANRPRSIGAASCRRRRHDRCSRASTKMSGSVPFVDAARIFALASGVTATAPSSGCSRRPPGAAFRPSEARSFCDAFEFVQMLRLREQHRRVWNDFGKDSEGNPNVVPLSELSDLDAGSSWRRCGRPAESRSGSSSTIRMSFGLASLRRGSSAGAQATATEAPNAAGRDRHRNLRPSTLRATACSRSAASRSLTRHTAQDSFEIVLRGEPSGDAANIAIHGIGHGAQAQGVPAPAALTAFREWTAGAPCVGFHADFDRAVLRVALAAAGVVADDTPWLDLASLARALAPEASRNGNRGLDDSLAAFGIECATRHNAAADALRPPSSCCACAPSRRSRDTRLRRAGAAADASRSGWAARADGTRCAASST